MNEVVMHLKEEFEIKDLGKTNYCLGLQIEHMPNGILVHQSNYTEEFLKRFHMDKAKSLSTPMVGISLNVDNDPFHPCEEDEDVLGPEVPYLSAIRALFAISRRSQKQTLVATSSNHAEVIALHEARRECVWLRSMT
ncbi:putative RNA-directed DNA polymerase [Tanacetum coccineum]